MRINIQDQFLLDDLLAGLAGPIPDVFVELTELEEFTANDNMLRGK